MVRREPILTFSSLLLLYLILPFVLITEGCGGSVGQGSSGLSSASVSISAPSMTVTALGTQQFTATVTGTSNSAVTWSASAGTISSSGLFTAPACTSNMSVTITATSQADTTRSASATITVQAPVYLLSASPSSLNFGNVALGSTLSLNITLTNNGNSSLTITGVNASGAGFSASGVSDGTVLAPGQAVNLIVGFDPGATGSATGSVTVASNATNSPTTIFLSGTGSSNSVSVTSFGATGNGTTDDTASIESAIATLTPGATLSFPCGTYLTSSVLFINVASVTVDGSSCATIRNASGSTNLMVIGGTGDGGLSFTTPVALSAIASELFTSFTTAISLGANPGDYVVLEQGGKDSSTASNDTQCDVSGCRGEVAQVASISGNTVTVTRALHDTYDPVVNAATARVITGPLPGIIVKNLTFDGGGTAVHGLVMSGVVNSTVTGVTAKNVQGAAIWGLYNFNVEWNNITVTGAGSDNCGDAVLFAFQALLSVNGMSISNENPGQYTTSACLGDGAFGFGLNESTDGTITNLQIDAAGAYGRPFKTVAARYNTLNSLTVENGVWYSNGVSLEYYSSHNTFNNCVVTNNGAGQAIGSGNAGINLFGNFNQYNTFNNCTVSGNGNVQMLIGDWDALKLGQDIGNSIIGGTYTGTNLSNSYAVILIACPNNYIASAHVNGPAQYGIYLQSVNSCVNNNIFGAGTSLGSGIDSTTGANLGSDNVMNGNSSNLPGETCTGP